MILPVESKPFKLAQNMFLLDTNVISELKKRPPNAGVIKFFEKLQESKKTFFISAITQGELLAGVEKLYQRNDIEQAKRYEQWIHLFLDTYQPNILDFNQECAKVWATLMGKNNQNPIDKQIGATALVYDLTLVTRNIKHFSDTPVQLLNPFY
ncbi:MULTISPECIES: type II toxin-antitoxin system VapC family toxin [unclassified Moraxella]|uniref:type II toxin-antitoxin system VapC family toxin n=1 Tax=unclassified Moraxella TaxID=2685852 RepID=UPI003AF60E52